jgi:hypothetical protein
MHQAAIKIEPNGRDAQKSRGKSTPDLELNTDSHNDPRTIGGVPYYARVCTLSFKKPIAAAPPDARPGPGK